MKRKQDSNSLVIVWGLLSCPSDSSQWEFSENKDVCVASFPVVVIFDQLGEKMVFPLEWYALLKKKYL